MLHSQCFAFIQKSGKKSQTRWGCSHDPMKAPTVDAINIFIQKTSLKKVYFSGLRQKSSYPLARCKLKNTLRLYKNGIFKWIFNISTCINRILSINSHPEIINMLRCHVETRISFQVSLEGRLVSGQPSKSRRECGKPHGHELNSPNHSSTNSSI